MIEKMKFVSISGPKNDLDRMVNQYLSHYEIQLENALTELRSASKLEPYPGTNPYREPLQKAQKLLASCPGAKQQEISTGTMPVENAITLVNDMDTELAASDEERESLKAKEKEVSSLLEQVRLYVELDFDIPAILKLKHIKYRFGRIRKESFPQLQAFADRSDETILFKCHESDHYISLLYFTPDITSDRIDTVFSSLQFERIYLPDEYAGTPKTEVERLENELANLKAKEQALDAKELEAAIGSFVSGLSADEKKIFILRYWYLVPIPEISKKLCYSQGKIKSSLFRTRRKLHAYLQEEGLC